MTKTVTNPMERGRDTALLVVNRYGLRYAQSMVDNYNAKIIEDAALAQTAPEFWRGFRNEVAALNAIASRKAR